uniref:Uncharacterized protein n=1 Tax=Alexandrium monilatum TaxID=311494 RepID=A0A7S4RNF1_9DINO
MVPVRSINQHLDACLAPSTPSPKRPRKAHHIGGQKGSGENAFGGEEGELLEHMANGRWKVRLADGAQLLFKTESLEAFSEGGTSSARVLMLQGSAAEAGAGPAASSPVAPLPGVPPDAEAKPMALPGEESEVALAAAASGSADCSAAKPLSQLPPPHLLQLLGTLHARVEWTKTPQAANLLARQVQEWKDLMGGGAVVEDNLAASFGAVEAHLSSEQRRITAELEQTQASASAQVARWRRAVEQHAEESVGSLEAYQALGAPTTYQEMCERNQLRSNLERAVSGIMDALEGMHQADNEPGVRLQEAEESMLGRLGLALERLRELQEGAERLFAGRHSEVQRGRSDTTAALTELRPHIQRMDGFVQRCAEEVAKEAAERQAGYEQQLEDLKVEEARYVRANDSPRKNPKFANVREEMESVQKLLEDQQKQEAEQAAFRERWRVLMGKMPSGEEPTRKRKWYQLWA